MSQDGDAMPRRDSAGQRRHPPGDPDPPPSAALLAPPRLPRLQALAPPRLRPPVPAPLPRPPPPASPTRLLLRHHVRSHAGPARPHPYGALLPGSAGQRGGHLGEVVELTCCHGLLLGWERDEFRVFDPMSGHRHSVPSPAKEDKSKVSCISAAVLPLAVDSSDRRLFRIVALFSTSYNVLGGFASIYSSESGVWEDSVTVLLSVSESSPAMIIPRSSTVVDNAIYWTIGRQGILESDLNTQSLSFIELPLVDADVDDCFKWQIMGAKGGQLGLAILADLSIQFWERETNHGKHARWLLRKTVQSDNFLPAGCSPISILGFAEESKAIFLTTGDGLFMVHLKTMQYRKVLEEAEVYQIIPY